MKTKIKGKVITVLKDNSIVVKLSESQLRSRFSESTYGKKGLCNTPRDLEELIGTEVYVKFEKNK